MGTFRKHSGDVRKISWKYKENILERYGKYEEIHGKYEENARKRGDADLSGEEGQGLEEHWVELKWEQRGCLRFSGKNQFQAVGHVGLGVLKK